MSRRDSVAIVVVGVILGAALVTAAIALLSGLWHWAMTWSTVAGLAAVALYAQTLHARTDRLDAVTGAWRTAKRPTSTAEEDWLDDLIVLARAVNLDPERLRRLAAQAKP